MQTEHIVITCNTCGHTERDYVLISYSGNSDDISQYVATWYGKESGQYWRIATPAERKLYEFRTASSMTDKEKIDILLHTLSTLAKDAHMALAEEWDRSDDGFSCQLTLIDEALNKTGLTLPE